jgi:hypothetical protein
VKEKKGEKQGEEKKKSYLISTCLQSKLMSSHYQSHRAHFSYHNDNDDGALDTIRRSEYFLFITLHLSA